MRTHYNDAEFRLAARFDGDFWFVEVYELLDGKERLRYEYKLNAPGDEQGACARAWEIFKARNLS